MIGNQSIFTDRPASIIIKQSAYVTTVTLFCSMFGPSSNNSSLVFFTELDLHLHSFFKNLKSNRTSCISIIYTLHLRRVRYTLSVNKILKTLTLKTNVACLYIY